MKKVSVVFSAIVLIFVITGLAIWQGDFGYAAKNEKKTLQESMQQKKIKNLSKEVNKKTTGRHDIGFLNWKHMDRFCYSMFRKVLSSKEKNPVLSPLSAYLALALTADGARGDTRKQFDTLLGDTMLSTRIHQLTESFSEISGSTKLSLANSIWIDSLFLADSSWLSNMVTYYDAEIFQGKLSTDAARLKINRWISKKTKGLIPSMLEKNLEEDSRLVLMNTIYLKAKWKQPFEVINQQEFTNENGKKIKTVFMEQRQADLSYFKDGETDGIILPYDDGRLSMVFIRPGEKQTVRTLAKQLTAKKLSGFLKKAKTACVDLSLPKFTIEYSKKLNNTLSKMGLTDAFLPEKADFSGLGTSKNGNENLFIDKVLQKIKIQVDEGGTEAAGATDISMMCTGVLEQKENTVEFFLEKPFIYLILDTGAPFGESSIPLFMGAVTEVNPLS